MEPPETRGLDTDVDSTAHLACLRLNYDVLRADVVVQVAGTVQHAQGLPQTRE